VDDGCMLRNRWADRGQAHASTRHGEANDEEAELGVLFRNAEVTRFALDSLLEEAVRSEPVSEMDWGIPRGLQHRYGSVRRLF
jgi:hypothetical protein